ncbi:hypothetical protein [Sporolactobacillus sp. THM19-2]|uniref:hypothetical protein n=1 Tax=Sporolactobacillus sp. THM19-2 TaxID=2511171 RepID=UPI0013E9FADB|nr:hypothetical protein [Sporolactobacillus sp. THM19-2]
MANAKAGTRLYLLPGTLSEANRRQMVAFLQESSTEGLSPGDIQTAFSKNKKFGHL